MGSENQGDSGGERRESSVRNLQFLYSIFVALALESVIQTVIDTDRRGSPIVPDVIPLTIAFLFILVPFYHGALRHLDDAYITQGSGRLKPYALIGDFVVLFIESAIIYSLAREISEPWYFAWFLVSLLAVDAVWGAFIRPLFIAEHAIRPELMWAKINFVTIGWLVLVLTVDYAMAIHSAPTLTGVLVVTCIVRTTVDYVTSWSFYFPD